jgi:hypothetical protein
MGIDVTYIVYGIVLNLKTLAERPLGKLSRRYENIITINLKEKGVRVWDWINVAEDRDR